MKKTFTCRQIAAGKVRGEVLTCTDQILFYHTDPKTGVVTEVGHALEGVSVKDKILVFPGGKGSSVVQMDGLYKLELNGAAPLGFIAVSYTHLDVYKRQPQGRSARGGGHKRRSKDPPASGLFRLRSEFRSFCKNLLAVNKTNCCHFDCLYYNSEPSKQR